MNEEISKKIAEVDAAIYGAELSMSYYRGRVEAFEVARKLLAQSEMSGYLKDAEDERIRKEQKPAEWNEAFVERLMDCMCAAQQYRIGTISWDIVEGWAEELNKFKKPSETEALKDLPRWKFAKQGTKLPAESIIRYDRENDLRLGNSATWDCYYIPVKDLLDLLVLYE